MFLRASASILVDVAVEAAPHPFFCGSEGEKLPVIVFSHGLASPAKGYSVFCKEMASYGIVVVAPDFNDGSCCYTVN